MFLLGLLIGLVIGANIGLLTFALLHSLKHAPKSDTLNSLNCQLEYQEGYIDGIEKTSEIFNKVIKEKFEKFRGNI